MYIGYVNTGISKSRFDLTDISLIADFSSNIQVYAACMDIGMCLEELSGVKVIVNLQDGLFLYLALYLIISSSHIHPFVYYFQYVCMNLFSVYIKQHYNINIETTDSDIPGCHCYICLYMKAPIDM